MSSLIEVDIYNCIKENRPIGDFISEMYPLWKNQSLSNSEINAIGHLLYINNDFKVLLSICIDLIERDEYVCWNALSLALKDLSPHLDHPVFKALSDFIVEQKRLDEFIGSDLFDSLFPNEKTIKLEQLQNKVKLRERKRETLLDQVRIFKQSKNYLNQKQSLEKFLKCFPGDEEGLTLLRECETEELQRFFSNYRLYHPKHPLLPISEFTEEEQRHIDSYFNQIQLKMAKSSRLRDNDIYSFVYFFIFINDLNHAIQILDSVSPSLTRDWLRVELLIKSRKFAEGLSQLITMESKEQNEPDFILTKVYFEAQCLWGLGERLKAIDLMENVAQIRPDYRLSYTYLREWKTEA